MKSTPIRSLLVCALGVAAIAGCSSTPSRQTASAAQSDVRSGKIASIDSGMGAGESSMGSSSGSSMGMSQARGGSADTMTVNFNDGSQKRYVLEEVAGPLAVGQPVSVVPMPNGDHYLIRTP